MKNTVLVLVLLIATACQTNPRASSSKSAPEVHNYILDGSSWNKDLQVFGLSAFVEMNVKSTSDRDRALFATIKTKTEDQLKGLGFNLVKTRAEAHLWILLDYNVREYPEAFTDQNVETTNGHVTGTVSVSESFVHEGRVHQYSVNSEQGPIGTLGMVVYSQDYGQRPETLSWKRIRGPANSVDFAVGIEKVADSWIRDLAQVKPLIKEKKQAGPPGCTPRFGFEVETFSIENVPYKRVIEVLPKSPAQKAGIRVGDVILAIDSIPYADFSRDSEKSDKVYDLKVAVPIKFLRKTQEMRSHIKPKVMCD